MSPAPSSAPNVELIVRAARDWSRYVMRDLREKGFSRREVLHGEVGDLPAEELRLLRMVAGGWEPEPRSRRAKPVAA